MKSVLAFLAVSAFFVAINCVGAGVMWGLGWLLQRIDPAPPLWASMLAGLAGVAAAVGFAALVMRLIGRPPARSRGRVRG